MVHNREKSIMKEAKARRVVTSRRIRGSLRLVGINQLAAFKRAHRLGHWKQPRLGFQQCPARPVLVEFLRDQPLSRAKYIFVIMNGRYLIVPDILRMDLVPFGVRKLMRNPRPMHDPHGVCESQGHR